MTYPLYHTFAVNDDTDQEDLTSKERSSLLKKLSNIKDASTREAVIMLIVEHSKVVDGKEINPENLSLPYKVKQTGKDVSIDLDKLPVPLRRILWKFMVNRS